MDHIEQQLEQQLRERGIPLTAAEFLRAVLEALDDGGRCAGGPEARVFQLERDLLADAADGERAEPSDGSKVRRRLRAPSTSPHT